MRSLVLAVASALVIAPAAYAQYPDAPYYRDRGDAARVVQSTPVYAEGSTQECLNPRTGNYEQVGEERSHLGAGTAIGAVAGGVLGHQIGSGRGNDVGTAAGAILGGIVGHEIEKDRRADDDLDMSRCRMVGDSSNIQGYDVRYRYQGQEYVTRLDHDPGSRLRLGDDINTDGTPYEQAAYTPSYSYR